MSVYYLVGASTAAYDLTGDHLFILAGSTLIGDDTVPITLGGGAGVNNYVVIDGEVYSATHEAIAPGVDPSGSSSIDIGRTGVVKATAATAIDMGTGAYITSAGEIYSSSGDAISVGNLSDIVNTGWISGLTGVNGTGHSDIRLTNSGSITAPNVGVDGGANFRLTNTGEIVVDSDVGIGVRFDSGRLANSGTILSSNDDSGVEGRAIVGGSGANSVLNTGSITGDVDLGGGADRLDSQLGRISGVVRGGDGNDILVGSAFGDHLEGDAGKDKLVGGAGDDALDGGAGRDTLTGGKGDDLLTGGHGHVTDVFSFAPGDGHDVITDFTVGVPARHDSIGLSHAMFADYADVQAHMSQVGADVLIAIDAADSILLKGVALDSLAADYFTFG